MLTKQRHKNESAQMLLLFYCFVFFSACTIHFIQPFPHNFYLIEKKEHNMLHTKVQAYLIRHDVDFIENLHSTALIEVKNISMKEHKLSVCVCCGDRHLDMERELFHAQCQTVISTCVFSKLWTINNISYTQPNFF